MSTRKSSGSPKRKPAAVHVFAHNGRWAIKRDGGKAVSLIAETQADAIERAQRMATRDKVELVVFDGKGEVQERRGFGTHPRR